MNKRNSENKSASVNQGVEGSILHVGRVDEKQIQNWKDSGQNVHHLQVEVNDKEVSHGYFKSPERLVIAKAYSELVKGDIVKSGELIFNNCWLDGDVRMKNVEDINIAACVQLVELVQFKNTKLGKL